jgi:hypothetical protein
MKKEPTSVAKSDSVALEKSAKGSRNMWELLLQLRVLLPYLAKVVPLLEPLLDRAGSKPAAFDEISQSITALQTGGRDLEVQARNQALQLGRIESQLSALRTAVEANAQETRALATQTQNLGKRLTLLAAAILVLLVASVVMAGVLLAHMQ